MIRSSSNGWHLSEPPFVVTFLGHAEPRPSAPIVRLQPEWNPVADSAQRREARDARDFLRRS